MFSARFSSPISALAASPDGTKVVVAGRDILSLCSMPPEAAWTSARDKALAASSSPSPSRADGSSSPTNGTDDHSPLTSPNSSALTSVNGSSSTTSTSSTATSSKVTPSNNPTLSLKNPPPSLLLPPSITKPVATLATASFATATTSSSKDTLETGIKVLQNLKGRRSRLNFSSNDVKWNPVHTDRIATGSSNGVVLLFNLHQKLNTSSKETKIEAHTRSVNRVCWDPASANRLLSGGQGGTVKLWDTKAAGSAPVAQFRGGSEVRELQFCPSYPNYFATAYENGSVRVWDIRNGSAIRDLISAHQGIVLGLDWHPRDPNIIATGGRDKLIKVWNLTTGTAVHAIQSIASVARVQWRPDPNHPNQIAACSSVLDSQISIWDPHRPYIPVAYFGEHKNIPTALVWNPAVPDVLLSAGKDSLLVGRHIDLASRPYRSIRTVGMSWNRRSQIATFTDPVDRTLVERATDAPPPPLDTCLPHRKVGQVNLLQSGRDDRDAALDVERSFAVLASKYMMGDEKNSQDLGVAGMLAHNAAVARDASQASLAHTWEMMRLLVNDGESRPEYSDTVERVLEWHVERGDVQSSVVMALILGDAAPVSPERLGAWAWNYVDLLHRHELWNVATRLIRCVSELSLHQLNAISTTVYSLCGKCKKPLMEVGASHACAPPKDDPPTSEPVRAKIMNYCGYCHIPVRGPYLWCQGCGHGGHPNCLDEWYSSGGPGGAPTRLCVSGCGHQCGLIPAPTNKPPTR